MTDASAAGAPADLSRIVKAYDVRGVAYEEFTVDAARALGAAFSDLLDGGDMIVAHDMRVSSPELSSAFVEGAVRRGSTVAVAGLSSTDQLYCASGLFNAAGAMFTASHNPGPDNGIKMCFPGAKPVGRDSGLLTIRDAAQRYLAAGEIPEREGGEATRIDTLDDYVNTVLDLVPVAQTRPLRVVVDAGNAMAGHTMPAVAERLPNITIIPLFFELDGTFPNHEANPLDFATLADLQAAVLREGADLGLAFDGDADRCIVVDERGAVVSPSAITAMIASSEIARAQAAGEAEPAVVANLVSSRHVAEAIAESGGRMVRSRVGHSIIKALMAQENAVFGGEHSAHYYFRDFFFADSGMLAALHTLSALQDTTLPLSELVAVHDPYSASGEINSRVESVEESTAAVRAAMEQLSGVEFDELDGMTVTHWDDAAPAAENWWFSLRPSNTEPLLRLNVEAAEQSTMERVRDEVLEIIRGTAPAVTVSEEEASSEWAQEPVAAAQSVGDAAPAEDEGAVRIAGLPDWVSAALRCPVCRSPLTADSSEVRCTSCERTYSVVDGVPMLIAP